MNYNLSKKALVKKTVQVSLFTFMSRIFGIIREILLVRYLGIGVLSDAFITAFKIPNFFRHIFAEGALSASFVPQVVHSIKENNKPAAEGLMSLSLLFFEGIVIVLYLFVLFFTSSIVRLLAPGFSEEQIAQTIPFLRIMFPFLLFVSSSALFAGALQAVNHFFAPAFGPALWNIIYVLTIHLSLLYLLPASCVATGVLIGGLAMFALHYYCFKREGFSLGAITPEAIKLFKAVLKAFVPCLLGVSIVELNLFAGGLLVSYLPAGSVSLLYYGQRFLNIPIGVFAVALSNTLLPHFSRMVVHSKSRLNFYLLEVAKVITWVMLPVGLFLAFIAPNFFTFLLAAKKVLPGQIEQVVSVFIVYLAGLLFICFNKTLLSMLYSLKDTRSATWAAGVSAGVNIIGDAISVFIAGGVYGIAAVNGLAAFAMTLLSLYFLAKRHGVRLSLFGYLDFLLRYLVQVIPTVLILYSAYYWLVNYGVEAQWQHCLTHGYAFLPLALSLGALFVTLLWFTRRLFGIKVYFINR